MRFSNVVLVLAFGTVIGAAAGAGCSGGGSSESTGTGGSGGSGTTTSSATGTGGGSVVGEFPCSPDAKCIQAPKQGCIGLEDNTGKDTFGLRMAQITMVKPAGLAKGAVKSVVEDAVLMKLDACTLTGSGSFSLLMQFDTKGKTLKVGGALPAMDPAAGYKFATGMFQGLAIDPVQSAVTIGADGTFTATPVATVTLPIYIMGNVMKPGVLLPLHEANISGKLTDNNDCIGKYNADTLDPMNGCVSSGNVRTFTDGANLVGYVTLEEADNVVVDLAGGQSLCVILTGDAATYGDGGMPNKCKRTGGVIDFKGDWCAKTNTAADATCTDAARLEGGLAASSVKILN